MVLHLDSHLVDAGNLSLCAITQSVSYQTDSRRVRDMHLDLCHVCYKLCLALLACALLGFVQRLADLAKLFVLVWSRWRDEVRKRPWSQEEGVC